MRFNAGANLTHLVVFALIKRILLLNARVRQVAAATKQVTIVNGHRYTFSEPVCSSRGGRRPPWWGSWERLEDFSECRTSSADTRAPPEVYQKAIQIIASVLRYHIRLGYLWTMPFDGATVVS